MNKIKYLLLLFLCCGLSLSYAQKRISGHVFNPKDGPIMMANVLEIDANNRIQSSTQTDMSGNFALTIKNPKNKLKVYFYGYRPFEQVIGEKTSFRIQLADNTQAMKEVKITGRKVVKSNGLTIPEREVSVATQKLDMDEMNSSLTLQVLWIGYQSDVIYFDRQERKAGKGRWTFSKKFKLVLDSFVSFTYIPIRLMWIIGVLFFVFSFVMGISILIEYFTRGVPIAGWPSLMFVILLS